MPRLPPALIRQATSENPLLTQLLRVCRDLPSARNELRWLQEHARDAANAKRYASHGPTKPHGGTRAETPKEMDRSITHSIILDPTEIEDSHITTESKKQGVRIGQHFRGHVRRVGTGTLIRQHLAHVGTDKDLGTNLHLKGNPGEDMSATMKTSDQKLPGFKLRYQNHESDPTEAKPMEAKRPNASNSNPVKIRYKKPLSFKIKTWSPEGTRIVKLSEKPGNASRSHSQFQKILAENVEKRSLGMPLQYIIGNQPFGTLDILCRRGVLIPRPETEIYTEKVAKLLLSALNATGSSAEPGHQRRKKFRVLDLCTGTGCIALLLHSILKPLDTAKSGLPLDLDVEILGVDLNPKAVDLARKNLDFNIRRKLLHPDAINAVSFQRMDVLALARKADEGENSEYALRRIVNSAAAGVPEENLSQYNLSAAWDMVIANPPYIGPDDYALGGKTEPSVRDYEPKEALVPVADGRFLSSAVILADLFYQPLIRIAQAVDANLLVMEVGGSGQAVRVGKQILKKGSEVSSRSTRNPVAFSKETGARLETWRDDEAVRVLPTETPTAFEEAFERGIDAEVSDRAVVMWSGQMADWRRGNLPVLGHKIDRPAVLDSVSEEIKADLKRAKDEAKEARRAMKMEHKWPLQKYRDAHPPPQFSREETFLADIWMKRQQEAAGTEVTWTASQKRALRAIKWKERRIDKNTEVVEEVEADIQKCVSEAKIEDGLMPSNRK